MKDVRPIGYIEVQRSWVGKKSSAEIEDIMREVLTTTRRDYPDLQPYGSRMEIVADGAGVLHYTLYAGFEPKRQTTPPLDPSNLNDAPPTPIGWGAPEDALGVPLGQKERKF